VGRLEPLKGIDILIEAMAQIEHRDARLLIVGGDEQAADEMRRLRSLISELRLDQRISFVGSVEQKQLANYYSAADVCVVPSYYESFGLVAVEAMACGTPVIASRVGGLATTVEDGETGYLIPWRCPEPFAERIDLILGNDELRRNLGRAARQAMRRFGWERITRELAAEYARVWQERAFGAACHGVAPNRAAPGSSHLACDAR
jgi:D-inositol-3-phosphate glycosyltransferase